MKKLIVMMYLLMAGSAFAAEQYREFQVGDRYIEARIMKVDAKRGEVELVLRNKQRRKVKISIFSEKDQKYIKDFATVQAFKSQSYKIEVEKNVLDRSKQTDGGIIRETESICYDINISNNTGIKVSGVTIAYNIFYEQEEVGRGENVTKKMYVDGKLKVKSLAPRKKSQVQTKKYEIYDQRLGGGYDGYVGGAPTHQSGRSKGVWLKAYIKTSSGLSAMREICLPKNTSKQFAWQSSD